MAETAWKIEDWQRQEIINQIGKMNLAAISGLRVIALPDGVELPVGAGYKVRVRLTPLDYYRVERVLVRGGKEYEKGHLDEVDCFQVSEAAYYASCYANDDNGEWSYGKDRI